MKEIHYVKLSRIYIVKDSKSNIFKLCINTQSNGMMGLQDFIIPEPDEKDCISIKILPNRVSGHLMGLSNLFLGDSNSFEDIQTFDSNIDACVLYLWQDLFKDPAIQKTCESVCYNKNDYDENGNSLKENLKDQFVKRLFRGYSELSKYTYGKEPDIIYDKELNF